VIGHNAVLYKADTAGLAGVVDLVDGEFDAVFMSFALKLFSEEDLPKVLG
jgi:hypothetical protein